MDEWKNDQVADRSKWGGRVVWKKEKVNKWEMPSTTNASKSTDPPSHGLHALEFLGRQSPALG